MPRKYFQANCSHLLNCTVYRNCDKERFVLKGAVPPRVHEDENYFTNAKFREDLRKFIPVSDEMQFLLQNSKMSSIHWVTQQSMIKHYTIIDVSMMRKMLADQETRVIYSEPDDPENFAQWVSDQRDVIDTFSQMTEEDNGES